MAKATLETSVRKTNPPARRGRKSYEEKFIDSVFDGTPAPKRPKRLQPKKGRGVSKYGREADEYARSMGWRNATELYDED